MRQFISDSFPDKKGLLVLTGKNYRYFRQVLRIRQGDMVSVRLPDGKLLNMTATCTDDSARSVTLQVCAESGFEGSEITRGVKASEIDGVHGTEYWLFQFLPKLQKFEQIVKQAAECGVSRIIPVTGDYTEAGSVNAISSSSKLERLSKIVKEARQQSGSPVDTKICEPVKLEEALRMWKEFSNGKESSAFVLYERNEKTATITESLQGRKLEVAAIACGCEGGISPEEIEQMTQENLFIPVHFEGNILRCETAALYGMAALQVITNRG